jgi:hypothetical protein
MKRLLIGLFAITTLGLLPSITEAGDRYRGYSRPRHSYHHGGGYHRHHHHGYGRSRSHFDFSFGYSRGYSRSYYHRPYYYDTVVYRAPRVAYYDPAPYYYEPYCAPRYYPTRYHSSYDYYPSRSYFSFGFGYKQYR